MPNEDNQQTDAESNLSNLPARLQSASLVLHRTQAAVGLLRDVVQESSAEYWYERGKQANAAEEWEKAGYAFKRCIGLDAQHWRGQLQLAGALMGQHQPEASSRALVSAYSSQFPFWPKWQDFKSELPDSTFNVLLHGLTNYNNLSSGDAYAELGLALVYDQFESSHQAKDQLYKIFEIDTKNIINPIAWLRVVGHLHVRYGIGGLSMKFYDRLAELNPTDATTYHARGVAQSSNGSPERAIESFTHALELNPRFAEAYYGRASAKDDILGGAASALIDYSLAIGCNDQYADAYYGRAKVKFTLGDVAGSFSDYDQAILINSEEPMYFYSRALDREKINDIHGAIDDYNHLVKSAWANYASRAELKLKIGDAAGAIDDYDIAIKKFDKNASYYAGRAIARARLGDVEGATADNLCAKRLNSNTY